MSDLVFLGTGASGGTPGDGRSARMESSVLVRGEERILIDVTRDFSEQSATVDRVDLVLLTHAHRDATGGVAALRDRCERPTVLAHPETIARLTERYVRLDHLDMVPVMPGTRFVWQAWTATPVEVPHASDPSRFPTYAWRLGRGGRALVYVSDVSRMTRDLAALAAGATVLVLDGAGWGRGLPNHLRVDRALETVCGWPVERVLLTQVGRTAPPHEELARRVAAICPRARPAYDGFVEPL